MNRSIVANSRAASPKLSKNVRRVCSPSSSSLMKSCTTWRRADVKSNRPPLARRSSRNFAASMKWPICVTRRCIGASKMSINSSTRFTRLARMPSRTPTSASYSRQTKYIMVAFKEEFPYLRAESGQLFEFDRDWLHAAINRAADQAGYPSWWLTEHVTESIAFYLHLRNDESVVAFSQLSQTVRYVLKAIGYKEIVPFFEPAPPPISISLLDIAYHAGAGYELAFFDLLEKRINNLIEIGADNLQLCSLQPCVKHLRGVNTWTRSCDRLREEIVCFVRERLTLDPTVARLDCSLR